MSQTDNQAEPLFEALVNDEEQYSLWPAERAIPAGWRKAGKQGSKEEVLAFVDKTWVDMRPLSARN